jgi:hypothetical protein
MGRCQRGVHFGAACLKRAEEVANFLLQIFALIFSLTIFKQLFNFLSDQN